MSKIQPEIYDEFGEIVEVKPVEKFERKMSAYDTHRIHETKDYFDGSCTYCVDRAQKKWQPFKCSKCEDVLVSRADLNEHWLLEH